MTWMLAMQLAAADPTGAAAYHGDMITHPGAVGRLEVPLVEGDRALVQAETEGGVVWHPSLMTRVHLRTGLGTRWTGPRNGTWGAFAHIGVGHGLWTSPTFEVAAGEVRRTPMAGDTWLVVAIGPELGRAIAKETIQGWFVRPQLGLRAPTFHGIGYDAGIELGVRFGGDS